ncbi:MAG: metallophosphatase domain-containing protein [Kiritimatiellae bacterium]|nr:metallophosphatase domain-containing protein [Kiritimatiellia bacterium]
MRIVCISDTHGLHDQINGIPDGDVLVHAGDLTNHGELEQVQSFNTWLGQLPHAHKLVIAGNHDFCFEKNPDVSEPMLTNATYLRDSAIEIDGVHFYGSPWQPWFYDWAFNLRRGSEIRAKWDLVPKNTDVLITHGPPANHGDETASHEYAGCKDLLEVIDTLNLQLHVFGHIHEGYGTTETNGTRFVNASTCTLAYQPTNPAIVIDI